MSGHVEGSAGASPDRQATVQDDQKGRATPTAIILAAHPNGASVVPGAQQSSNGRIANGSQQDGHAQGHGQRVIHPQAAAGPAGRQRFQVTWRTWLRQVLTVLTILFALPAGINHCDCDHCGDCELLSTLSWVLLLVGVVFGAFSMWLEEAEEVLRAEAMEDMFIAPHQIRIDRD